MSGWFEKFHDSYSRQKLGNGRSPHDEEDEFQDFFDDDQEDDELEEE